MQGCSCDADGDKRCPRAALGPDPAEVLRIVVIPPDAVVPVVLIRLGGTEGQE